MGQRLTTMTSGQARFPDCPVEVYRVHAAWSEAGMWVTELLPWTRQRWSTTCAFCAAMHTEAINHEPAISYMQTGNQITGQAPASGAWASYGLGSLNENLPTFVVLIAAPTHEYRAGAGDLGGRLWSSGIPARANTPVSPFRTAGDPILFINNPPGVPMRRFAARRSTGCRALNEINLVRIRRRSRKPIHANRSSTNWPSGCSPASPTSRRHR